MPRKGIPKKAKLIAGRPIKGVFFKEENHEARRANDDDDDDVDDDDNEFDPLGNEDPSPQLTVRTRPSFLTVNYHYEPLDT